MGIGTLCNCPTIVVGVSVQSSFFVGVPSLHHINISIMYGGKSCHIANQAWGLTTKKFSKFSKLTFDISLTHSHTLSLFHTHARTLSLLASFSLSFCLFILDMLRLSCKHSTQKVALLKVSAVKPRCPIIRVDFLFVEWVLYI